MAQRQPDYWYATDEEGTKFFREDVQISLDEWRAGAPPEKRKRLKQDESEYGPLKEAPVRNGVGA